MKRFISFRIVILISLILGLAAMVYAAPNGGTSKGPEPAVSLKDFLAVPGHSADVLYMGGGNQPSLLKDFHEMPPHPDLVEKLKKEGKWKAFVEEHQAVRYQTITIQEYFQ